MYPDNAFQPMGGKHNPFNKSMKLWGGGKGGGAPDPNPGMVASAEAAKTVAASNEKIAADSLAFYKSQYEDLKPMFQQITASQLETDAATRKQAEEYYQDYKTTYRPVEQKMVADALNYNTDAKREELARTAGADVSQAFGVARGQQNRQLAAAGIRPDSNRFAALNSNLLVQEALGRAGAQNKARVDAEGLGYARLQDAVSLGKGLPGNSTTAYGVSINAGNAAGANANNSYAAMNQGFGTAINANNAATNAYGTAGNIYGQEFSGRMQGYNAQQQASGGFARGVGSLIGTGLSMGTGGGASVGAKLLGFADGGPLDKKGAIRGPGGPVDDKIPAMLSNGEYVLPADTVKAIGKDKLDKVVKKTHTPAEIQRKRKALKGNK
jgi:hypothetical protein